MHRKGIIAGGAAAIPVTPLSLAYTIYNLELVTTLIYPKPDFVDKY